MKEDLTKLLMQSYDEGVKDALDSVKEALAQPVQTVSLTSARYIADEDDDIQVYQRPWVDLTIEEIAACCMESTTTQLQFARAVLAKSKEKNNG